MIRPVVQSYRWLSEHQLSPDILCFCFLPLLPRMPFLFWFVNTQLACLSWHCTGSVRRDFCCRVPCTVLCQGSLHTWIWFPTHGTVFTYLFPPYFQQLQGGPTSYSFWITSTWHIAWHIVGNQHNINMLLKPVIYSGETNRGNFGPSDMDLRGGKELCMDHAVVPLDGII